jgi:predicted Zn-dependent protease
MSPYFSSPHLSAHASSQKLGIGRRNILSGFFILLSMSALPFSFSQGQSSALEDGEPSRSEVTSTDLAKNSTKLPAKYDVSQIGQRGIGRGINLYSSERERKLGNRLAEKMDHSLTIIDDPLIKGYLNRIAQALAEQSDVSYNVSVKLVYDDEVNAYSLPGGHLYMTTGLLLDMQSETEMAMVMAHEIAHVEARHDTRTWTREILWNLPFFPILKLPGPIGYSARQITSELRSLPVLKFDRNTEYEADLLGMEYAYSAGYDPHGILDLYERSAVEDQRAPNFIVRLFDTHPTMKERLRRAKAEIMILLPVRAQYVLDTSEFRQSKCRLRDLVKDKQRADRRIDPFEVKP